MSEDEFLQRAMNVPMEPLAWDLAKQKGVDIVVRRDDLIDESLSGNKFYKLFYSLQQARKDGHRQLLSFGGAYSNHLYALAAAGRKFAFKTVGVIRGERPKYLSPTLQDAERWGMQLHFVSRADYAQHTRQNDVDSQALHENLLKKYGDFYSLPEGGASCMGLLGASAIGWAIEQRYNTDFTGVCLACGTGNTLAGIAAVIGKSTESGPKKSPASEMVGVDLAASHAKVIGFSVLKGEGDLGNRIVTQQRQLSVESSHWRLVSGYHGGGYAKKLPRTIQDFSIAFERETALRLDPVYTLKMCWGVAQLLSLDYWPRGSRLILIHTGGLQGRRGFKNYDLP